VFELEPFCTVFRSVIVYLCLVVSVSWLFFFFFELALFMGWKVAA
jgi:hypothetical protein